MLAQEGHLASSSLLAGFEALAKLDYDRQGTVYSALFQLATGPERFMKICVILNHKLQYNLTNPSSQELRKYGHNLTDLYSFLRTISEQHKISEGWFDEDAKHGEMLNVLSQFARTSRYYNVDELVGGTDNHDPLVQWFNVHMGIAAGAISDKRLCQIMTNAQRHCDMYRLFGWEMGPKGQYDLTIDVNYQLEVTRISRGHCVWAVIQLLEPLYQLIVKLVYELHELETEKGFDVHTVPYMAEFFPFCLADRQSAIRRKAWTTLFHIGGRI